MELKSYERLDDLQIKGLFIIQDTRGFCFGTDAVLLSDFAEIKKGARVLDMCTGTGIIPLLLSAKTEAAHITGVEILGSVAETAQRSVLYNKITNIDIVQGDIKNSVGLFGKGVFDAVTCNPPYKKAGSGLVNPNDAKAVSRHEIFCSLEDVISQASAVLKDGGKLFLIHRPARLAEIIAVMKEYSLEPKRMRLVAPSEGKAPNLVLIEAVKGGGSFLKVMPTLNMYKPDGVYTDELLRIYERT